MSTLERPETITINPVDGEYMIMGNPLPVSRTFIYSPIEIRTEPEQAIEASKSYVRVIFPAAIDEEVASECRERIAKDYPTDSHEIQAKPTAAVYPEGLLVQLVIISKLDVKEENG